MLDFLKNIFKTKTTFDVKAFEEKWPVGSWYKSHGDVARLSNVYIAFNIPMISVETPCVDPVTGNYRIEKQDGLPPAYIMGWLRVKDADAEKLEVSYWKALEKELEAKTNKKRRLYDDFVKFGTKK